MTFGGKDQATQEDNRDVVRLLHRNKIKRANAQLELNQATAEKDNKDVSKNTSSVKGGLRRISILHWMQVETLTKGEEKAEALNAFFGSVFKSKSSSPKTLSWNIEWNEAPIIQGEVDNDLHTSPWGKLGSSHGILLVDLVEELTKILLVIYQQSWLHREVPVHWKLANVTLFYKMD